MRPFLLFYFLLFKIEKRTKGYNIDPIIEDRTPIQTKKKEAVYTKKRKLSKYEVKLPVRNRNFRR